MNELTMALFAMTDDNSNGLLEHERELLHDAAEAAVDCLLQELRTHKRLLVIDAVDAALRPAPSPADPFDAELAVLVAALEAAKPGDRILVTGFGQGCDALVFEATDAIAKARPVTGVSGYLARGRSETNYQRYLAFNDLIELERGLRSEVDKQTGMTTLYRNKEMLLALIGGKCTQCGTLQFPKTNVCVNPNCGAVDSQDDHPFSSARAKLNSFTADRLTYSPDPPAYYGMVQFDEGGRVMIDFTDVDPVRGLEVGMPMHMVFRVKDYDTKRGFRRYYWKAAPVTGENAADTGD